MIDIFSYFITFAIGAATASVFMLILWRSLQRLAHSRHNSCQLVAYGLVRHGIAYSLLYLVIYFSGETHLISALLGFITVRTFVLGRLTREKPDAIALMNGRSI